MNTVAADALVDQAVVEIADAFAFFCDVHHNEFDNVFVAACSVRACATLPCTTIEMRSQAG